MAAFAKGGEELQGLSVGDFPTEETKIFKSTPREEWMTAAGEEEPLRAAGIRANESVGLLSAPPLGMSAQRGVPRRSRLTGLSGRVQAGWIGLRVNPRPPPVGRARAVGRAPGRLCRGASRGVEWGPKTLHPIVIRLGSTARSACLRGVPALVASGGGSGALRWLCL